MELETKERFIYIILVLMMGLLLLLLILGCQTPQTVVQSPPMAIEAIDTALENMPDNSSQSVIQPLLDAKKLLGPVQSYFGPPGVIKHYDHASVDRHVWRAEMDVKIDKAIKQGIKTGLNAILPEQLRPLLDKFDAFPTGTGKGKYDDILMGVIVAISYLLTKGGLKVGGKVINKFKNGN